MALFSKQVMNANYLQLGAYWDLLKSKPLEPGALASACNSQPFGLDSQILTFISKVKMIFSDIQTFASNL